MSDLPLPLAASRLRAHLLASLTTLPGCRTFNLHVLVSSPRKPAQSLFRYAPHRPKCVTQDILVLLSEQIDSVTSEGFDIISRIFVSAIEASVYSFPVSNSTILYISKVDGTGQGLFPSPTSTLLRSFLEFYASPPTPLTTHHLWIHLFARSQRQYLFPNSADHPNKKPLGDVALCKWWKKILTDVAKVVTETSVRLAAVSSSTAPTQAIRLYYVLPGQTELEASYLLREAQPSCMSSAISWTYSHPYNTHAEMVAPHPSGSYPYFVSDGPEQLPLAALIPHFEDDPKSRFLDELAATSEEQATAVPVPTPKRKRARIEGDEQSNSTLTHGVVIPNINPNSTPSEPKTNRSNAMQSPPPPEIMYIPPSSSPCPLERDSPPSRPTTPKPKDFRNAAFLSPHTPLNLPTFPISLINPHAHTPGSKTTAALGTSATPGTPQTPRTPRRPKSDLDIVSPAEFWERIPYRQECAQGAVTGFFVAIFSHRWETEGPGTSMSHSPSAFESKSHSSDPLDVRRPLLSEGTVPHSVIKRVMTSLLTGVEFSTAERAIKGTEVMETAIQGLCEGLGDMNEGAAEGSGNMSSKIYHGHVYASISVSNPPSTRKTAGSAGGSAPVNVLGVRRKKKRE
ncbi:hypothetical protein K439DRAFT_1629618, partial [Ramaria rubella]